MTKEQIQTALAHAKSTLAHWENELALSKERIDYWRAQVRALEKEKPPTGGNQSGQGA